MNRKILGVIALVIIIILAIVLVQVFTQETGAPESISIKFGYRPISTSLDFFVAMDKGYFEEEGITVEIEMFRGSSDLADAVMSGQVDFATDLGMITQLLPMMRNNQYRVLFLSLDLDSIDSPMRGPTLVVKRDLGINEIEDLKGKNIGIFPGINFRVFLEALLKAHGLDIDQDVTVTQIPPQEQMSAFTSVDALLSLDPITSGIETQHNAFAISDRISARYIFDNFPAAASSVNAEFAQENPEVVAKVERVLARGIDFVRTGDDEIDSILAKWISLPVEVTKTMEPVKYAKNSEIDIEGLQKTINYLREVPWLNLEQSLDASRLVWKQSH